MYCQFLIRNAIITQRIEIELQSNRLAQMKQYNESMKKMLADQRAGTANIEQQKQQLEKEYNELLDQKENLKKRLQ